MAQAKNDDVCGSCRLLVTVSILRASAELPYPTIKTVQRPLERRPGPPAAIRRLETVWHHPELVWR